VFISYLEELSRMFLGILLPAQDNLSPSEARYWFSPGLERQSFGSNQNAYSV
jgi:hypothetical protein